MLRYFCNCIPKHSKTTTKEKYLETISYTNTIPFVPPITSGKVIKVYDGDTITIASKLPFDNSPIYRFSVRLLGIDSPEIDRRIFQMGRPQGVYMNFRGQYMKIRNVTRVTSQTFKCIKSKTSTEKQLALTARDALSNIIMDKIVNLKNISTEKYGRVLADVYLHDLHVNQWMLDNHYAVPYDGGTKHRPTEWDGII